MQQPILVYAEHRDGRVRRASLEAVSEARRLAGALGSRVECVLVGSAVVGLAAELASYGADSVHVFEAAGLAFYATEVHARAVAGVIGAVRPSIVLSPSRAR